MLLKQCAGLLEELQRETLTEKNRRLLQGKCSHAEIYSSTVTSGDGTFTVRVCLDCGKSFTQIDPARPQPPADADRPAAPAEPGPQFDPPYDGNADLSNSIDLGFAHIRDRMANGGPGWKTSES